VDNPLRQRRSPAATNTSSTPSLLVEEETMPSLGSPGVGVGGGENFDALRREATKLERHLEDRVARYQEVSACVGSYAYACIATSTICTKME